MAKAYDEDRPTTTLPGSSGTVSGTAVTDWVDDEDKGKIETTAEEGKVEFRKTEEFRKTAGGVTSLTVRPTHRTSRRFPGFLARHSTRVNALR